MLSEFEERKLMEMVELMNEDKSRYIKRNNILSDEEKEKALEFFKSHANLESKVKWQGKDEEVANDILYLMNSTQEKKEKKEKEKESYRGNVSFDSNWKVYKETPSWIYAIPLNKEAAKFADSYACGGQGAQWCIGARDDIDNQWNDYYSRFTAFLFCFNKECEISEGEFSQLKLKSQERMTQGMKYMIEISHNAHVNVYDQNNIKISIDNEDAWNAFSEEYEEIPCPYTEISWDELMYIHEFISDRIHKEEEEKRKREEERKFHAKEEVKNTLIMCCKEMHLSPQVRGGNIQEEFHSMVNSIWGSIMPEGTCFPMGMRGMRIFYEDSSVFLFGLENIDMFLSHRDELMEKISSSVPKPVRKCILSLFSRIILMFWDERSQKKENIFQGSCTPLVMIKKNSLDEFLLYSILPQLFDDEVNVSIAGIMDDTIYLPEISIPYDISTFDAQYRSAYRNMYFKYHGETYECLYQYKEMNEKFFEIMENEDIREEIMNSILKNIE